MIRDKIVFSMKDKRTYTGTFAEGSEANTQESSGHM